MPRPQAVFEGEQYGLWTVVEYRPNESLCECACGNRKTLKNGYLTRIGSTVGCYECGTQKITGRPRDWPSDLSDPVYRRLSMAVRHAISRCTNPQDPKWPWYGGRGIRVCQEWLEDPGKFIRHLASLPGHDDPGLWLDRTDNDAHYEQGNLQFVTPSESRLNQRRTQWLRDDIPAER